MLLAMKVQLNNGEMTMEHFNCYVKGTPPTFQPTWTRPKRGRVGENLNPHLKVEVAREPQLVDVSLGELGHCFARLCWC